MTLYRGLVLQGGGAKGAWQFGVLKALAQRGVQFDAVSGTSVGALNGAIWSANRTDFGEKMWSEISLSSIFLRRPRLVPVLVISGFSQLYFAFLSSLFPPDDPLPKSLQWFFSALTVLPLILLVVWLTLGALNEGDWGWQGWGFIAMLTLITCALANDRSHLRFHFLSSFAIMIAFGLCTGGGWVFIRSWLFWVATAPLWLVGLALATRFANLSYFSPEPLTKTIDAVLKSGLSVPLFVTSSREVFAYFDPDNVSFVKVNRNSYLHHPIPLSAMKAEYNRIDNLSSDEACEALLASSALPFSIAPARRDSAGVGSWTVGWPIISLGFLSSRRFRAMRSSLLGATRCLRGMMGPQGRSGNSRTVYPA